MFVPRKIGYKILYNTKHEHFLTKDHRSFVRQIFSTLPDRGCNMDKEFVQTDFDTSYRETVDPPTRTVIVEDIDQN